MKENRHIVRHILQGSIAGEMDIEKGDEIVSINGQKIRDIFDYQYLVEDESLVVLVRKPSGEEWELEIEKDPDEDLGIEFENPFMDDYHSCSNRCIFCFIDQMPRGMRDTLYFKDDDSRLSFLQGNYVTLTNMSEEDIDRIIRYRMEPINISFHATNPELRCRLLNNRFAGDFAGKVQKLFNAGIEMNGQIVLCRGLNDGEELERSIRDLSGWIPQLRSVSVVPVGLTRFREGLYPLEPFGREDAERVIDQIERWQRELFARYGTHFVHASDEWYLLAGRSLPEEERYDGYLQLENGVGMLRLLDAEVGKTLDRMRGDGRRRHATIATGTLAAPIIRSLADRVCVKFPGVRADVIPVTNHFFGERITVSGLITGRDLTEQLKDKVAGEELLIPCNMLRAGEDVFLDDIHVPEVERALGVRVRVVSETGEDFVRAVIGENPRENDKRRQMYEQTDRSNRGKA